MFWTQCRVFVLPSFLCVGNVSLLIFQMIYWQPRVYKQRGFHLILTVTVPSNYAILDKKQSKAPFPHNYTAIEQKPNEESCSGHRWSVNNWIDLEWICSCDTAGFGFILRKIHHSLTSLSTPCCYQNYYEYSQHLTIWLCCSVVMGTLAKSY